MALDGVSLYGACIPSASYLKALNGYMTPASSVSGSDTYSWWFYQSGSNMAQIVFKNGAFFQNNMLFAQPPNNCSTTETFFDGVAMGWGVAVVMIAAYAIHLLRRGLT